jgi:hypothetical protein
MTADDAKQLAIERAALERVLIAISASSSTAPEWSYVLTLCRERIAWLSAVLVSFEAVPAPDAESTASIPASATTRVH